MDREIDAQLLSKRTCAMGQTDAHARLNLLTKCLVAVGKRSQALSDVYAVQDVDPEAIAVL
jgi:hypothetical protein